MDSAAKERAYPLSRVTTSKLEMSIQDSIIFKGPKCVICGLVYDPKSKKSLGLIFAGHVPLASKSPYPIIVYSVANYRPRLGHFWTNMYTNFCDPNLVTFYFYELAHFLD